jgi:hypothetical protein
MFAETLMRIVPLRAPPALAWTGDPVRCEWMTTGETPLDECKQWLQSREP